MLSPTFLEYLHHLGIKVKNTRRLSGGDISDAYLIDTATDQFFLKTNTAPVAEKMFVTEQAGLELLAKAEALGIPKVMLQGKFEKHAFILLQYIESKHPQQQDMEHFGLGLAQLHQYSADRFGWEQDNFIGSLPQSNQQHQDWSKFYWEERLLPQIRMALQQQLLSPSEIPTEEKVSTLFEQIFQEVKASLLHGDLWNGNYFIAPDGQAYLIDPAVYFGHHEVDIAMSKLFGGFSSEFYDAYYSIWPQTEDHLIRIELFQLYYLLAHLNLFGGSYRSAVQRIFQRYF